MITAASDKRKQQCKEHGEENSDPSRRGHTADATDCDSGKSRMPKSVREKAHSAGDDHGRHESKKRREQQNRQ